MCLACHNLTIHDKKKNHIPEISMGGPFFLPAEILNSTMVCLNVLSFHSSRQSRALMHLEENVRLHKVLQHNYEVVVARPILCALCHWIHSLPYRTFLFSKPQIVALRWNSELECGAGQIPARASGLQPRQHHPLLPQSECTCFSNSRKCCWMEKETLSKRFPWEQFQPIAIASF